MNAEALVPQFSQMNWQEMNQNAISIHDNEGQNDYGRLAVDGAESQRLESEEISSELRDSEPSEAQTSKDDSTQQSPYLLINPNFEQQALERAQRIESIGRRGTLE